MAGDSNSSISSSQTCKYYLLTKHRRCKFAAVRNGLCGVHMDHETNSNNDEKKQRVPCPLDPRHTIYRGKLLGHLKGCTKTRDVAWELCQPFLFESINDPLGNRDYTSLKNPRNSIHNDENGRSGISNNDFLPKMNERNQNKSYMQYLDLRSRDNNNGDVIVNDLPNNSERSNKEKCESALMAGYQYDKFIETLRLPKTSITNVRTNCCLELKKSSSITSEPIQRQSTPQYDLLTLLNLGRLIELHQHINLIYNSCCQYLKIQPNYFLDGIITNSELQSKSIQPLQNTTSSSHSKFNGIPNDCPTDKDHTVETVYCNTPPTSENTYSDSRWNSMNNSIETQKKTERKDDTFLRPDDFMKLDASLPFTYCWTRPNANANFQLFKTIVKSAMKEVNRKRDQTATVSLTSSISSDHEAPIMNKHEYQNASILALCLSLKYLDLGTTPMVTVEFGAGRGGLTRWFVLASTILTKSNKAKFVLIDREKRRNRAEGKDEALFLDREVADASILRLRLDIRDFDFGSFLNHLLVERSNASIISRPLPRLLQFLRLFGSYPFPPTTARINTSSVSNLLDQNYEQTNVECQHSSSRGGQNFNSNSLTRENADSRENVQQLLLDLGEGGGISINKILKQVNTHFTSVWINESTIKDNNKRLNVISLAKHLCGGATDAALRAICNGVTAATRIDPMLSNTNTIQLMMSLAIAPCCHHRCKWETTLGQEFLLNLGMSPTDFSALVLSSGWGTGATGLKQLIGIKSKRIIDIARIYWLHQNGFSDATLIKFVMGRSVTIENVIITGQQLLQSHYEVVQ